jgi:acetyl esterase/lipase
LQGGAYVMDAMDAGPHAWICGRMSRLCNAKVYMLDYKTAPAVRIPDIVGEGVAFYRHLLGAGLATPSKTVFAGDSAGGHMTLAVLRRLVASAPAEVPAAGWAISPWLDMAMTPGCDWNLKNVSGAHQTRSLGGAAWREEAGEEGRRCLSLGRGVVARGRPPESPHTDVTLALPNLNAPPAAARRTPCAARWTAT